MPSAACARGRRLADVAHAATRGRRRDEACEELVGRPCARALLDRGRAARRGCERDPGFVRKRGSSSKPEHGAAAAATELVVAGGDHGSRRRRRPRTARSAGTRCRGGPGVSPVAATPRCGRRGARARSRGGRPRWSRRRRAGAPRARRSPPRPGREVDERDADAHRRHPAHAGDAHDPARRLQQRVVARLVAQRADGAERTDRAVDERRVARAKRLGAEAVPLGEPGAEALHERRLRVSTSSSTLAIRPASRGRRRAIACPRSRRTTSRRRRRRTAAPTLARDRLRAARP